MTDLNKEFAKEQKKRSLFQSAKEGRKLVDEWKKKKNKERVQNLRQLEDSYDMPEYERGKDVYSEFKEFLSSKDYGETLYTEFMKYLGEAPAYAGIEGVDYDYPTILEQKTVSEGKVSGRPNPQEEEFDPSDYDIEGIGEFEDVEPEPAMDAKIYTPKQAKQEQEIRARQAGKRIA